MNFLFWLLFLPTQTIFYTVHILPIDIRIARNKALVFAYDVAIGWRLIVRAVQRVL